jgi:DEAD/DEAH box helicase domain-containing protein
VRVVEPLDLPAQSYETKALWFDIPPQAAMEISRRGMDLPGGLHALEHAAISILPLFAMCDRNDIGGISTPNHPDTGKAQVFIYDAFPGGVGISEKGFQALPDLWRATLRLLVECPCETGCPSCVHSPKCGNNNEPLDKQAAKVILEHLLGVPGTPGGGKT